MGTHLSNTYSEKLHDSIKKSTTDVIKTPSKKAIQKKKKMKKKNKKNSRSNWWFNWN